MFQQQLHHFNPVLLASDVKWCKTILQKKGYFYSSLLLKICLCFDHNQMTEELRKLCFQTNENTWLLLLDAWQTSCLSTVFFLSSFFFPHKLPRHARSLTITSEHDSMRCALCQEWLFTDHHGTVQKQSMLHVITFQSEYAEITF